MSASAHGVARVTKRGRVHKVECQCGVPFESITSEAMARSYHSAHRRLKRKSTTGLPPR